MKQRIIFATGNKNKMRIGLCVKGQFERRISIPPLKVRRALSGG